MILLWGAAWGLGRALPSFLISIFLLGGLIIPTWFDFDHYRIPNWTSYPLILSGLGLAYMQGLNNFVWHALGAITAYGFIWGLNVYWRQRHRRDGIGMGDAKLLAAAGAWIGPLGLPFVTLIASGSALLVIIFTNVATANAPMSSKRVAFGPYIAFGFWGCWLFLVA